MNVWVVKTSEMLGTDSNNGRLLRSGIIAHMLDARGHRVTWWMSTFDHANRRNRGSRDFVMNFGARGVIRLIHSPGYKRSISWARMRDHTCWARAFRRAIAHEPLPDIIFCAYPTIEAAVVCARFGAAHAVPVVIDLRDMWPDIFVESTPAALKPMARLLLWPWRRYARNGLRRSSALFGITEEFLAWGLALAGRSRRPWDGAYLLAYPEPPSVVPDDTAHEEARRFWDALGVSKSEDFNIVCIGSMTARRFEMPAVIAAARDLQRDASRVKFILAGDGDDLENYRKLARGSENVIFPGWLNAAQIRILLGRAHLGLVPYRGTPDLLMSVPNKVGEYLAAGVPVATCLRGTLARMLSERRCGMLFEASVPESLVALVRKMQDDPVVRNQLSINAVTAYRDELDSETVYGRLIARLETIAAQYTDNRCEPSVERMGLGV